MDPFITPPSYEQGSQKTLSLKTKAIYVFVILVIISVLISIVYFFIIKNYKSEKSESQNTAVINNIEAELVSETKGWRIYSNQKYGFEFKYPSEMKLREGPITFSLSPDSIVVNYVPKNKVGKVTCQKDDGLFLCTSTKLISAGNINAYIYLEKGDEVFDNRALKTGRSYFQDYVNIIDSNGNKITIDFFSNSQKDESSKLIKTTLSTFKLTNK